LPHYPQAARSQCKPHGNLAGTICSASRQQTAQVGACRQQNQDCQQYQSPEECAYRSAEQVAKTRTGQTELRLALTLGISLLQPGANRVQIVSSLGESDARLQAPYQLVSCEVSTRVQHILPRHHDRHKEARRKPTRVPRNPGGAIPIALTGRLLSRTERPNTPGSS
jgi:hypothetical protein